ncbi:MAG TPA: sugar transferase, partial [Jiangellales bacterium]|nr:sugar transferase [Jiangellales bacterium]
YEPRFLGNGPEEYHRVALAALVLVAAVGTVSWAVKAEVARSYVAVVIPVLAVGSVLLRRLARRRLHRRRAVGECLQRTVVVGPAGPVADLVQQLRQEPHHGLVVVAACLPDPRDRTASLIDALTAGEVLTVAGVDEVLSTVDRCGADVLAVLPCPELGQERLRRLAWSLEDRDVDLLMAPAVLDVAGPRTTIRPVSGVPLLHVATPELSGSRRVARALLDRVGAAALLVLALPVLLGVAVAVRVTSPGPALFRQRRVGLGGREFTMLKFRTMVRDAEDRLAEVAHLNTHREGVLFKAPDDPRVTRLGAWLRRTSLDELPQLFNVLTGSMSLVGPRPPLPGEARRYEGHVHRRFLVRPGLTGLWQVSGRADLSWEESVRLDLRYVEHWSFALDISILWRTLLVVLRRAGAY